MGGLCLAYSMRTGVDDASECCSLHPNGLFASDHMNCIGTCFSTEPFEWEAALLFLCIWDVGAPVKSELAYTLHGLPQQPVKAASYKMNFLPDILSIISTSHVIWACSVCHMYIMDHPYVIRTCHWLAYVWQAGESLGFGMVNCCRSSSVHPKCVDYEPVIHTDVIKRNNLGRSSDEQCKI